VPKTTRCYWTHSPRCPAQTGAKIAFPMQRCETENRAVPASQNGVGVPNVSDSALTGSPFASMALPRTAT